MMYGLFIRRVCVCLYVFYKVYKKYINDVDCIAYELLGHTWRKSL